MYVCDKAQCTYNVHVHVYDGLTMTVYIINEKGKHNIDVQKGLCSVLVTQDGVMDTSETQTPKIEMQGLVPYTNTCI